MGHDSNYAQTVRLVVCMSPNLVLPSEFGLLWPQNFKAELRPSCSPQIQMDGHLTKHFYEQNFMSWGFGTILTHFGQNWGQKSRNLSSKNQIFYFFYTPWIRELTSSVHDVGVPSRDHFTQYRIRHKDHFSYNTLTCRMSENL